MTPLEVKILFLLKNMRPYETLEVKLDDGEYIVTMKSTVREVFARPE